MNSGKLIRWDKPSDHWQC